LSLRLNATRLAHLAFFDLITVLTLGEGYTVMSSCYLFPLTKRLDLPTGR